MLDAYDIPDLLANLVERREEDDLLGCRDRTGSEALAELSSQARECFVDCVLVERQACWVGLVQTVGH